MLLSPKTITALDEKLKTLKSLRPIAPSVLRKIREQFEIEMTYNSNAIEGNSLTLKETFWVINEGMTIKDKPLKDHLEAKNHQEALGFLYELVDEKNFTMSEYLVKQIHQLVVQDSQRDIAGKYRDGDVIISGSKHKPPNFLDVPHLMKELMEWLRAEKKKLHPVEFAALFHYKFVNIHPFWDGNGRTGRILMNVFILQKGYPLAIILKADRKRYYRVLSEADEGKYNNYCEFIAQAVLRSLTIYLQILKPTTKKEQQNNSLKALSIGSPYSANYLRKLATQGKLEAHKEGRNWVTTKEAVQHYIKNRQRKR